MQHPLQNLHVVEAWMSAHVKQTKVSTFSLLSVFIRGECLVKFILANKLIKEDNLSTRHSLRLELHIKRAIKTGINDKEERSSFAFF